MTVALYRQIAKRYAAESSYYNGFHFPVVSPFPLPIHRSFDQEVGFESAVPSSSSSLTSPVSTVPSSGVFVPPLQH
jgi:hypothetical protein